jgi:hypothetical protein
LILITKKLNLGKFNNVDSNNNDGNYLPDLGYNNHDAVKHEENTINESLSNNFEFPLGSNDTILVLTVNKSVYKDNVGNVISKMMIINELKHVNLDTLSLMLGHMKISELKIFSIHNKLDIQPINILTNKGCKVRYMELQLDFFIEFINNESHDFFDYNKHSLYILRGGNYIDIKNIFTKINNQPFNLGRGGSQKAHVLSPLDLRLSSYMLAMSNFNHKLVNGLNTFNYIGKDRYLSWMDKLSLKKPDYLKKTK